MYCKLFVFLLACGLCTGDFFLHNPRGTNNRLNEANTNRNNNVRLFDSQNNAKGGYCYGPALTYYEGSILNLEYSPSHGCGTPDVSCTIVFQYMCSDDLKSDYSTTIRDGITTSPISVTQSDLEKIDYDSGQYLYGMHENYQYYANCRTRSANKGLFIADRTVNYAYGATVTRQNNNGGRSGLECPEERDYYPYWHPSPWRDALILTDDTTLCNFYQTESQNVKIKNYCQDPAQPAGTHMSANNKADCDAQSGTWTSEPAFGIPAPVCTKTSAATDNFQPILSTPWTIPTTSMESCIANNSCSCVFRARYNVSSNDWAQNRPDANFLDSRSNGAAKSDPDVPVSGFNLTLAIDTSQMGRVFQDRSFVFKIKPRPLNVPSTANIFNLNVKGKRGNIVQTFPAVQYDFSPKDLSVTVDDYIHFQWTGCDTNPAGNAGEGLDGTDRSNIVQISSYNTNIPATDQWLQSNAALFTDPIVRKRFAFIDQNLTKCIDFSNTVSDGQQDPLNFNNLNCAQSPYFDGGLLQMKASGNYFYMSTRNNNFSNRGQKGSITVKSKTGALTREVTGEATDNVPTPTTNGQPTINSAVRIAVGSLSLIAVALLV